MILLLLFHLGLHKYKELIKEVDYAERRVIREVQL